MQGIHFAEHNRAGVNGAITVCRSQYRRAPGMVPVLTGSPELFPNLLTNVLRSLEVNFHLVRIRTGPDRVNPNAQPSAEALA